jgi:hypothetical protein
MDSADFMMNCFKVRDAELRIDASIGVLGFGRYRGASFLLQDTWATMFNPALILSSPPVTALILSSPPGITSCLHISLAWHAPPAALAGELQEYRWQFTLCRHQWIRGTLRAECSEQSSVLLHSVFKHTQRAGRSHALGYQRRRTPLIRCTHRGPSHHQDHARLTSGTSHNTTMQCTTASRQASQPASKGHPSAAHKEACYATATPLPMLQVLRCANTHPDHDWKNCSFAHEGEKVARRDMRVHWYHGVMCENVKGGEVGGWGGWL